MSPLTNIFKAVHIVDNKKKWHAISHIVVLKEGYFSF